MTIQELIEFCQPLSTFGEPPEKMGKLCQDSRSVQPGDVFIAVRGIKSDGHHFIGEAIQKKAGLIICEEPLDTAGKPFTLIVQNTRQLLGPLAQKMAGNPFESLITIGITGTNGKTTVATLVWQILTRIGKKASLLGTVEKRINTQIQKSRLTTADPIELAEDMKEIVEAGSQYLVMEVSSHALDQERIMGIRFDVAAFTNLSHDHLDYHRSMSEYAIAKKKLFNGLHSKSWAITNTDDEKGEWMADSTPAKVLSFSFEGKGLFNASVLESDAAGLKLEVDGTVFKTPLVGRFNAYNAVQALLICTALGLEGAEVANILKECSGAPGRMERVNPAARVNIEPAVFVDYAHTPNALENVADTLKKLKKRGEKLVIIFGCGGDRDKTKRPEMAHIAEKFADRVVVTSDNPRTEDPEAIIRDIFTGFTRPEKVTAITSRKEAIETVIAQSGTKSIILIAGKGHETYQEIHGERFHFDDREIARKALEARNGHPKNSEVA